MSSEFRLKPLPQSVHWCFCADRVSCFAPESSLSGAVSASERIPFSFKYRARRSVGISSSILIIFSSLCGSAFPCVDSGRFLFVPTQDVEALSRSTGPGETMLESSEVSSCLRGRGSREAEPSKAHLGSSTPLLRPVRPGLLASWAALWYVSCGAIDAASPNAPVPHSSWDGPRTVSVRRSSDISISKTGRLPGRQSSVS